MNYEKSEVSLSAALCSTSVEFIINCSAFKQFHLWRVEKITSSVYGCLADSSEKRALNLCVRESAKKSDEETKEAIDAISDSRELRIFDTLVGDDQTKKHSEEIFFLNKKQRERTQTIYMWSKFLIY